MFKEEPVAHPSKPSINNLQKLRRKETQDRANAMHEIELKRTFEALRNTFVLLMFAYLMASII